MNYFIYIIFSLFTLSASAVGLEPLEDILKKDSSTNTHFIFLEEFYKELNK